MAADALLAPISPNSPAGDDLSEEQQFIQLRQAIRPPSYSKEPDYDAAEQLAESLLSTRSKDLQVAVFYAEALVHRQRFAGLRQGLDVIHGLLDTYWDHLYPRDLGFRRGPLATLGSADFAIRVQLQPLNEAGHNYWQYRQASTMPTAEEAGADDKKRADRETMLADGKLSPEAFAEAVAQTSKAFYKQLSADIDATLAAIQRLDALSKERFGKNEAPSYRELRMSVESVNGLVKELLAQKLVIDPDPVTAPESSAEGEAASAGDGKISAAVASVGDAENRVVSAAHYLRKSNPVSPASYLLLRALRWGELRANGESPDEKLLAAPQPEARSRLRALYLDQRWDLLLDAAEQVMATPVGRGWLDLQFYAVRACEGLSDPYDGVRRSIVDALRTALANVPSLQEMTLMDAMPTASPETKTWIAKEILDGTAPSVEGAAAAGDGTVEAPVETRAPRDVYGLAQLEAAAGRPERAIQLLMRELAHETSERARFLRRTQIATVMVETGLVSVAKPLLAQLIGQIDKYSLAEWEDGALVAQPLALMVRCLDAQPETGGEERREEYYLRVCTLNPVQAMSLTSR